MANMKLLPNMEILDIIDLQFQVISKLTNHLLAQKNYHEQKILQINLEIEEAKQQLVKIEKYQIFFKSVQNEDLNLQNQ
jgi:hypothetical protein